MRERDLAEFVDAWTLYQSEDLGFSFEYPLIYDEIPFCQPQESVTDDGGTYVQIGSRIQVVVHKNPANSIDDYIAGLTEGAESLEIKPTRIAGGGGFHVSYRYGGLGRLQEIYVVDLGELRAAFALTAPWICDFHEVDILEPSAFVRVLDTFSVLEPSN